MNGFPGSPLQYSNRPIAAGMDSWAATELPTKPSISRRQDSRSLARLAMSAASWMRMAIDGPATHRAYCLARAFAVIRSPDCGVQ